MTASDTLQLDCASSLDAVRGEWDPVPWAGAGAFGTCERANGASISWGREEYTRRSAITICGSRRSCYHGV
jgi:hypothetical protein